MNLAQTIREEHARALLHASDSLSLTEGEIAYLVTLRMLHAISNGADSVDREDFTRNTREMLALMWDKSIEARNY